MGGLLFVLVAICILLLLPIFLRTSIYYDVNKRKFSFSIELYRIFRILGGYVATYKGGLAIHVSDKKAIVIPYSELDKERKRFSFTRTFHLKSFILTTETGAEYLVPMAMTHMILRTYFFIKGGKKEKIKNNLWLLDGDVLRISLKCVFFFNGLMLLKSFFKFIKEKIILWQKKTKNSTI